MVAGRSVNESPRAPFAHLRACTKSSNAAECCSDVTCASLPPVPLLNIPASSLSSVSSDKTFVGNKAENRGPVLPLRVVEGVFSYRSQGLQGSPHFLVLVPPNCEEHDEGSCHDFHLHQPQELPAHLSWDLSHDCILFQLLGLILFPWLMSSFSFLEPTWSSLEPKWLRMVLCTLFLL